MQIRTALKYPWTPTRVAKIKSDNPSAKNDV